MYRVFTAESFEKDLEKHPHLKERVVNIKFQLIKNPYVGKPLSYKWFREKKLNGHRIYYLIYEDLKSVYVIALSDKKDQQKTINTIKLFLHKYRIELQNLIEKV